MFSQHFYFSLSLKYCLYPACYCTPSLLSSYFKQFFFGFWLNCMHVECHALEFTIFAAIAFCMLVIINSSHFVPYKTVQEVYLRNSTRMEPMVLVTFCIIPHPKDINTGLVPKSVSVTLTHINTPSFACASCIYAFTCIDLQTTRCSFCRCLLYVCYNKTIQVKLHEKCWYHHSIFAWIFVTSTSGSSLLFCEQHCCNSFHTWYWYSTFAIS